MFVPLSFLFYKTNLMIFLYCRLTKHKSILRFVVKLLEIVTFVEWQYHHSDNDLLNKDIVHVCLINKYVCTVFFIHIAKIAR
jgi:hypothetical protein